MSYMLVSWFIGVPPVIIHCCLGFSMKYMHNLGVLPWRAGNPQLIGSHVFKYRGFLTIFPSRLHGGSSDRPWIFTGSKAPLSMGIDSKKGGGYKVWQTPVVVFFFFFFFFFSISLVGARRTDVPSWEPLKSVPNPRPGPTALQDILELWIFRELQPLWGINPWYDIVT